VIDGVGFPPLDEELLQRGARADYFGGELAELACPTDGGLGRAGRVGVPDGRRPRRARRRGGGRRCACAWCCRVRSRTSGRRRRCVRRYACAARCSCCCDRSRSANDARVPRSRLTISVDECGTAARHLSLAVRSATSAGSKRTAAPRWTALSWPRSTRRWTVRGWTRRSAAASCVVSSAVTEVGCDRTRPAATDGRGSRCW
jgi:hypothetical protein